MDDIEQARIHYVKLTNGLPFAWSDRFDGIPFYVAPGKFENIPLEAAVHMLGFSDPPDFERMKRHVCRRMGWNTPEFVLPDKETKRIRADDYWAMLKIEPVVYKLVRVDGDEIDPKAPVPADPAPPPAAEGPRRPRRFDIGAETR